MRTSSVIIDELNRYLNATDPAEVPATVQDLKQQLIGHEHLVRLRAERVELVEAGKSTVAVDEQLAYWLRHVDEQSVDEPVVEPADVAPAAAAVTVPAETRPSRTVRRADVPA